MIDDGVYDVIVIDAAEHDDGTVSIDVAFTSSPHKGEVLRIRASNADRSWVDLLAMPGTLVVRSGEPHLELDA